MSRTFRKQLEAAVSERHCADHPMTEKWSRGELSKRCMMGWAAEQWHWVSKMGTPTFFICKDAPDDVIHAEIDNFHEEMDPDHSHLDIMLNFAKANGGSPTKIKKGEGLPTTRSWVRFLTDAARDNPWFCGMSALRIGTESQSPPLYAKLLPALRDVYKFKEKEIEHFWLHSEVDIEHGGIAYDLIAKHCKSREQQDLCVHFARESAKMRWFHFDGIYLHYEMGYELQPGG
jgi:pyrroloquinoline-quinone synthase